MQVITQDMLGKAIQELQQKDCNDIDAETAAIWGARALAAWSYSQNGSDPHMTIMAAHFKHEALEHAATAEVKTKYKGILDQLMVELNEIP